MFDLTDLRAFARIAELASISSAARSLHMPKSSVSRSLVRLEEGVGATLVERSTRHLRLTDAGLLLQRHARRILDDVGEAENAIGGLVGRPSGDLRVSVPFTFAAGPLAPMLPGFLARYPDVRVILTVDNRNVDILTEEIDVAIRIGPLADSELIARRIASFELWPCASPAYLASAEPIGAPRDLMSHRLIGHGQRRETWVFRSPEGACADLQFDPVIVIPEPNLVRTMLLMDAGIGVLPDFQCAHDVAEGRLVRLFPQYGGRSVEMHALYPSHRSLSAKVRVFIDSLVEHMAKEPSATL